MRTALATLLALAILVSGPTPAPAVADVSQPAGTPCTFSAARLSKSEVVIGLSGVVRVKASATATGCDAIYGGWLEFGGQDIRAAIEPSVDRPELWSATIEVNPRHLVNDDAGKQQGLVYVETGGTRLFGAALTVKHATRFDGVSAPKKAKKKKGFWVGTMLNQADWENAWYGSVEGVRVDLQLRSRNEPYRTIKSVRTMRDQQGGVAQMKVRLSKSGYLRWVYAGSITTQPAVSTARYVKVT